MPPSPWCPRGSSFSGKTAFPGVQAVVTGCACAGVSSKACTENHPSLSSLSVIWEAVSGAGVLSLAQNWEVAELPKRRSWKAPAVTQRVERGADAICLVAFNKMANSTQEEMDSAGDKKPEPVNSWQMSLCLQGEERKSLTWFFLLCWRFYFSNL